MNVIKTLEQSIEEQQQMLEEFKQLKRDRDFYLRVLMQAVLTHEGVLNIMHTFSDEAFLAMKNKKLEFGNGKVCFHGEKGSMFQE